ncbi:hypothetical protein POTOM_029638 [Populus tomentosa]|uniref:Uncharacterized protein n=1 Tax=Populus tomentosa TaxID=118781 RepID=A0A8X8CT85_POPTO|nr:hypothetical protein POTOM_029638 [Populus tomentosa]
MSNGVLMEGVGGGVVVYYTSSRQSSQKTRVQNYDETGRSLRHQGTEQRSYQLKLGLLRPSSSLDERSLIWALRV